MYFPAEKQESQAGNSWFCPDHSLKECKGVPLLKVNEFMFRLQWKLLSMK